MVPLRQRDQPPVGIDDRPRLREGVAGLRVIVAQKFEKSAMNLIGAGLGLRAHHARAGHAELGIVIRGRDLGLGHRVQRRVDHDPAQHRVVIVGAIQQVRCARKALAVDQHAIRPLRILGRRRRKTGGERDHARRHQLEVGEAAAQDRQIRNDAVAIGRGHVAALGLEDANFAGDFHGLAHLAHFQARFQADLGVHRHRDVLLHVSLEALRFHAHAVASHDQIALREVARLVRRRVVGNIAADVRNRDPGSGNGGAASVHHGSGDTPINGLRAEFARGKCQRYGGKNGNGN